MLSNPRSSAGQPHHVVIEECFLIATKQKEKSR
jgi:hypothetical protein